MLRDLDELEVGKDGLLYRNTKNNRQLVLPQTFKPLIYSELRDMMEHLGKETVLQLIKERFYSHHPLRDKVMQLG